IDIGFVRPFFESPVFRFLPRRRAGTACLGCPSLGSFAQIGVPLASGSLSRWVRLLAFPLGALASSRGRSWQDHVERGTGPHSARGISLVIMGHHGESGHAPREDSEEFAAAAVVPDSRSGAELGWDAWSGG